MKIGIIERKMIMFCGNCGKEIGDTRFCPFCGSEQTAVVTLAADLPKARMESAPVSETAPAAPTAPVQTAVEPIAVQAVSAASAVQTIPAPAAPAGVPVPGAIPTTNLSSADTEDHGTVSAPAMQIPEITVDLEKKPPREAKYSLRHLVMCLVAAGIMAAVAGVFAGLYFSLRFTV